MYKFFFTYTDGKSLVIYDVKKVTFFKNETVTVENEKILTYSFPIDKTLHLFADDGNSVVSSDGLRCITVTTQ